MADSIRPEFDYIHVECDDAFLRVGPDKIDNPRTISWEMLQCGRPICWNMLGESRWISAELVQDAWRVIDSYITLLKLGRGAEARPHPGFTRQQTLPRESLDDRGNVLNDESTEHAENSGPAENHPDQSLCPPADFH